MDLKRKTAALILMLLFFVGCTPAEQSPDFNEPLACTVTVEKAGLSVTGRLTRTLIGCYTLQVTQPAFLSGLTFESRDGETVVSLGSLSVGQEEPLPAASFFGSLTAVLDDMSHRGVPRPDYLDDQIAVYNGNCRAGDYSVVYDRKIKHPINLEIGDGMLVTMTYESVV